MATQALIPWKSDVPTRLARELHSSAELLAEIAPRHYNLAEFHARFALQFMNEPKLTECTPKTIIKGMINCVSMGLIMGEECNLVPFRDEAALMVEFHGWMRKFSEVPGFRRCITDVIREGDDFESDEINNVIAHKKRFGSTSKIIGSYCLLEIDRDRRYVEVLDSDDLDRHRKRARDGGTKGPWATNYKEMCRKSAVNAMAARYGGALGLRKAAEVVDEAARIEYQHTSGNEEAYQDAIVNLFGDRSEAIKKQETLIEGAEELGTDNPNPSVIEEAEAVVGELIEVAEDELVVERQHLKELIQAHTVDGKRPTLPWVIDMIKTFCKVDVPKGDKAPLEHLSTIEQIEKLREAIVQQALQAERAVSAKV